MELLFQDAIEAFEKALEIDPHHADALDNLGKAYGVKRDYKNQIKSLKKMLSRIFQ